MKILVLGGSQFVGRHIVEELVMDGHEVTVLNRGQTPDELPAAVERLRGDRDRGVPGLSALDGRSWDACVDVSGFTPRQVRPSAEMLAPHVGHYVFMSAVSVYGDPPAGPVSESTPRVSPAAEDVAEIDSATYGPLKVACEDLVERIYGDRCLILRPQIVAGRYDPYDRFSFWVRHAAQSGPKLAPGSGDDYLQVIAASDVAEFTRRAIENGLSGAFNLAGSRLTWKAFMELLGATSLVWVPADLIESAGMTEFELPLFRPTGGPRSALMHVSNERAVRAGLTLTDLAVTASNTRAWLRGQNIAPALGPEIEARLIAMARGRS